MANASRAMGMKVDVVDIDETALNRMKGDIYPSRYGAWDENISLHTPKDEPVGGHDLIIVGTPPDTHVQLAREAVKSRPSAILVEKPLCSLGLENLRELIAEADEHGVRMFIGYDHVVGKATRLVEQYIAEGAIGAPLTIDVEFREHWGGIFAAHPWLAGPSDSYLGFHNGAVARRESIPTASTSGSICVMSSVADAWKRSMPALISERTAPVTSTACVP